MDGLEWDSDPTAYVLSANVHRRHLTKGQQAMATALIYPDEFERGRGKKGKLDLPFSKMTLSQARFVLRHCRDKAELVLCNTQSELHPLEEGKHAAESGMDLKAYAEASGKPRTTLAHSVKAWRVFSVTHMGHSDAREYWRCLDEIHAAPEWLWAGLVKTMLEGSWTVATTRDKVGAVKDVAERSDLSTIRRRLFNQACG